MRPRVGLVVVDDGLYTHRWAAALLRDPRLEVALAACLGPLSAVGFSPGGSRGPAAALSRLRYYGLRDALALSALAAAERARDLAYLAGLRAAPASVASAARAAGVELLQPPHGDVEDAGFCERLAERRLDLLICAFSQRAERLLRVPALGGLNVHFSMLPAHRGREPSFRALLAGAGAGVSVHWMTPGLDAGRVVLQEAVPLDGIRTLHALIRAACRVAARLVPEAALRAAAWSGPKEAARPRAPLAAWPTPADVARFRAKGFRFA